MRKIMLLAAMVAMVLAAAAPALAQSVDTGDAAGDDQVNQGDTAVFNAVCQNIIGSFEATTGQYGGDVDGGDADGGNVDIDAVGGDDAAVVAEIAQEQNVSVAQVNECLNNFAATATASPHAKKTVSATATATATAAAAAQYQYASPTATATALPPTGGPVPSSSGALALGAGALLVAGGLLARRLVR